MPGWLAFLLLTGLVTGQLVFLSSGGPDRVLARSLVEEALWVQAGSEEEPAPSDGLLTEPPPLGPPASQSDSFALRPGQPGGLALGSIPVAFGENAPLDVPERAGMPRAVGTRDSAHRRVEAFDRPPGQILASPSLHPGRPEQPQRYKPSDPLPYKPSDPQPYRPSEPQPDKLSAARQPGGARPQPEKLDAYRKTLLAIYHLEQKGGEMGLTPAQARQMLDLVSRMEGVKGAVPEARRVFLEVLTPEQIDLVQARRVARGAPSKPPPPEELDREAQNALKKLGE